MQNNSTYQTTTYFQNGIRTTYIKESHSSNGVTYTTERTITGSLTNQNNNNNTNQNFFREFFGTDINPFEFNHPTITLSNINQRIQESNNNNQNPLNTNNQQNNSSSNIGSNHQNNNHNQYFNDFFFNMPIIPNFVNNGDQTSQNTNSNSNNQQFFNAFPPLQILLFPQTLLFFTGEPQQPKKDYSYILEKLPTRIITNEENKENNQCVICLNEYKMGEEVKETQCKHKYHKECIKDWFKENNTCPTCRRNLE